MQGKSNECESIAARGPNPAVHLPEDGPRVPKSLTIEYSDRSNASKWYQLEIPFVDAMHLLALLQGTKDDVGYKEPVEAPASEKD
jgi:hypothetical protein